MKLFFSANLQGPKELVLYQFLTAELKKLGISVITNVDVKKGLVADAGLGSVDAVIIDGTTMEAENGYLLAIALAHKKPVLYLIRKGSPIDPSVETLSRNKDIKKIFRIAYYSSDSALRKIKDFLQYLDANIGRESYNIKYTLRLSSRLDRYLHWKAEKLKKDKANFLRDSVEDLMKGDDEYLGRLK